MCAVVSVGEGDGENKEQDIPAPGIVTPAYIFITQLACV